MIHTVFVGLGSNLDEPRTQVSRALQELAALPQVSLLRASSLYRTAPLGYLQQPDFINAVAQLQTGLSPRELLDRLLALELRFGRKREFINAPRTLDLDLLLYDDLQHHEQQLTIPHPQMHLREFVLQPLTEIAPDCFIPGLGAASELLRQCPEQGVERLVEIQEE